MTYLLTVAAALVVAIGAVVQQRWAAQAPQEYNLKPRLLLWLVRRPRWVAGVGLSLVGNLIFAAALTTNSVVLIESVFVVRLIFALLIAAMWGRHRVPLREIAGAVAITVGLVVFLLVGNPEQPDVGHVPEWRWAIGGGCIVATAVLLTAIGRRLRPRAKATMFGSAAGALYGVQASLTQTAIHAAAMGGLIGLVGTWETFALPIIAVFCMLLVQSAFAAAPVEASYPAAVTGQLLGAICVGVWVLSGSIRLDPASLAFLVPALLLMIVGILLVARSPIVTGQARNRSLATIG